MNSSGWAVVVVLVVLIGGGTWWYLQQPAAPASTNTQQPTSNETGSNVPTTPTTTTVTYGPNGFSPSTVTIKVGDTVTFVNNGGDEMWVASAPHPAHTGYDGTDRATHCAAGYTGPTPFDQCSVGTNYSFMFQKAGTWVYHNHGNSGDSGTVIVQ